MTERALVKNAADPKQVRNATRHEERKREAFENALRAVLADGNGRHVVSELLEMAGLYASVYDHSGSLMYFKEGRRNFGLEIRAMVERVDERAADTMDLERRERLRRDNRSIDAQHTARASEPQESLQ